MLAVALAVTVGLASPTTAWAHNGAGAAFNGTAGPYRVYAYDPGPAPGGAPGLEYHLVLLNAATGDPVYGARITVTADMTGASRHTGPQAAQAVANVFYYDLPDPGTRDWQVHLSIDGRAGHGAVSYPMHGLKPQQSALGIASTAHTSGHQRLLITVAGLALLTLLTVAVIIRRRRTPPTRQPQLSEPTPR